MTNFQRRNSILFPWKVFLVLPSTNEIFLFLLKDSGVFLFEAFPNCRSLEVRNRALGKGVVSCMEVCMPGLALDWDAVPFFPLLDKKQLSPHEAVKLTWNSNFCQIRTCGASAGVVVVVERVTKWWVGCWSGFDLCAYTLAIPVKWTKNKSLKHPQTWWISSRMNRVLSGEAKERRRAENFWVRFHGPLSGSPQNDNPRVEEIDRYRSHSGLASQIQNTSQKYKWKEVCCRLHQRLQFLYVYHYSIDELSWPSCCHKKFNVIILWIKSILWSDRIHLWCYSSFPLFPWESEENRDKRSSLCPFFLLFLWVCHRFWMFDILARFRSGLQQCRTAARILSAQGPSQCVSFDDWLSDCPGKTHAVCVLRETKTEFQSLFF